MSEQEHDEEICEACCARAELEVIADDMAEEAQDLLDTALEKFQYATKLRTLADVLSDEQAIELVEQFYDGEPETPCEHIMLNTPGGEA